MSGGRKVKKGFVRITLNYFPEELWEEVRVMAVLNKCAPSHVAAVAIAEYMNKKSKGDKN